MYCCSFASGYFPEVISYRHLKLNELIIRIYCMHYEAFIPIKPKCPFLGTLVSNVEQDVFGRGIPAIPSVCYFAVIFFLKILVM